MFNTWPEIVSAWSAWVTDPESNPPVQWYNARSESTDKEGNWCDWNNQEALICRPGGEEIEWRVKPVRPMFRIISDLGKVRIHGPNDNNTMISFWLPFVPKPRLPVGYTAITDWADLILPGETNA